MKHILLGTTAIVAAGLMVGEAYAADNAVKLGFGGRYLGTAGGLVWDDVDDNPLVEDARDIVFKQDIEVHFRGEGVLDNGLTVGARIELEGQTQGGDQIDETWAELSGGFGALRFGDTSEALGQLCFLVPSASSMFGPDSPNFNFSNAGAAGGYGATNGTCYGLVDKSTKVVYFSPNFVGFSFAVSYTPDDTEDTRNTATGGFATRDDGNAGQLSEELSIAAQYATDFNGFNIALGGAYSKPFDVETFGPDDTEISEWNAYAQVGAWGFTLGGAFRMRNNAGGTSEDNTVYGVGITTGVDAYTVGVGWTHGDYDSLGDEDHDDIVVTGSYALGPGVAIDAMAEYSDYNGDDVGDDFEGVGLGLGLVVRF